MKYLVEYDVQIFNPVKNIYVEGGKTGNFKTDSEHKITIGRAPKNTIQVPSDGKRWSRRQVELFLKETGSGHEIYAQPGKVSEEGTQYGTAFEGKFGDQPINSGIYCFGDGQALASGKTFKETTLVVYPNQEKNPNRPPADLEGNCEYRVVLKITKTN